MTAGLATAATANAALNGMRAAGAAFGPPAGTYAQVHTGDPGAAGTSNISVATTTRVVVAEGTPAGGAMAISGTLPVWTNGTGGTPTGETLTHVSIWSAITAGTFLRSYALTTPKAWASADTFTLSTLGTSLTPLAA